jgi:transketolase
MNTQVKASVLRGEIMRVACENNKGHIAPSLSCLDILTVLYYDVMKPTDEVVLSKGHGCYGVYAILADKGFIKRDKWEHFNLPGCLDGFGALGHGLPIAVGMAYGGAITGDVSHVYCIVGDGELQEGSNWEALSFMKHHDIRNLTVIVDNNGLQAMERTEDVLSANLMDRFEGWGFVPLEVDGHSHEMLKDTLLVRPQIIIADTVKGHGFKCMENKAHFHYRVPNDDERYGS